MFGKLNIKSLKPYQKKVQTAITNMVKKKTATGCNSCGSDR